MIYSAIDFLTSLLTRDENVHVGPPATTPVQEQTVTAQSQPFTPSGHQVHDDPEGVACREYQPDGEHFSWGAQGQQCITSPGTPALALSDEDEWWECLSDEDRVRLEAPRTPTPPCPWCGGRTRHNPNCVSQCDDWNPRMPWGKFKRRRVKLLPTDYLVWLIVRADSVPEEIREASVRELGHRRDQIDDPRLLAEVNRVLALADHENPDTARQR